MLEVFANVGLICESLFYMIKIKEDFLYVMNKIRIFSFRDINNLIESHEE
jgi:hypothetical protein